MNPGAVRSRIASSAEQMQRAGGAPANYDRRRRRRALTLFLYILLRFNKRHSRIAKMCGSSGDDDDDDDDLNEVDYD